MPLTQHNRSTRAVAWKAGREAEATEKHNRVALDRVTLHDTSGSTTVLSTGDKRPSTPPAGCTSLRGAPNAFLAPGRELLHFTNLRLRLSLLQPDYFYFEEAFPLTSSNPYSSAPFSQRMLKVKGVVISQIERRSTPQDSSTYVNAGA